MKVTLLYITGVNTFDTLRLFDEMVRSNAVNSTNLQCPLCQVKHLDSLESLKEHIAVNHGEDIYLRSKPNKTCPWCKRTLHDCKYGYHLLEKTGSYRWKCKLCPNMTRVINSVVHKLKHLQTYHNLMLNKCAQCFKTPWEMNQNLEQCKFCGKLMKRVSMYMHCINFHLQEIPFCTNCNRYFTNENKYRDHLKNVETDNVTVETCIRRSKKRKKLDQLKVSN